MFGQHNGTQLLYWNSGLYGDDPYYYDFEVYGYMDF